MGEARFQQIRNCTEVPFHAGIAVGKAGSYFREARPQGLKIGVTAEPDHGGERAAARTRKSPCAGIAEAACACRTSGTTAARTPVDLGLNGHIVGKVSEKDERPQDHGASAGAAGDPVS